MFAALAAEAINMKMITTGDIKISVLVDKDDGVRALRAVHQAFELARAAQGGRAADRRRRVAGGGVQAAAGAAGGRRQAARPRAPSPRSSPGMEDIARQRRAAERRPGPDHVFDLPDLPGNCSTVFKAVATGGIIVDMIVQNLTGPGRAELSFTVPKADLTRALKRTQDVVRAIDPSCRVVGDADIAMLFVLGVGHADAHRRRPEHVRALAERGINIA